MTPRAEQPSLGELVDLAAVPPGGAGDPDADVVSVLVETPLAHLDRPFDYLVPPAMADRVAVGSRVRVRFAGRELGGYVTARTRGTTRSDLAPLRRAVSAVPVLAEPVARLCRAVARAHGGTTADVVRLAVPPRHAGTEESMRGADQAAPGQDGPAHQHEPLDADGARRPDAPVREDGPGSSETAPAPVPAPPVDPGAWAELTAGPAFLAHVAAGESPAAVVTALPGTTPALVVRAVRAALDGGRGALVVAPTARHVDDVAGALDEAGIADVVRLSADDGTARRYRTFLRALTGQARVVVGTRSAAFAPVARLGLVVVVDDGDDRLAEPRAPYPHVRDVLLARHLDEEQDATASEDRPRTSGERAALAIIGVGRSVAAQHLVATGVAASLAADRSLVRSRTPRVTAPTDLDLAAEGPAAAARIPHAAWRLVRDSLATGPVLVQVARAGYVPALACERCREPARCRHCSGPLQATRAGGPPSCRWCARAAADFRCPHCGSPSLRAIRVGAGRTSHELGRAFPGVPVLASDAGQDTGVARTVDDRPRLVVATPGAEPTAEGGYVAALLLDGGVATARPGLAAAEEALRRWVSAAALVRPATDGGKVLLLGRPAPHVAQALVRWDPVGLAERELGERAELSLPPAVPVAVAEGAAAALRSFLAHLAADARADRVEVLGPVPVDPPATDARGPGRSARDAARDGPAETPQARAVLRAADDVELGPLLAAAAAARSARKEPGTVRVQVAPTDML
ncbi:primosomal protein N' [Georgenia sp. Z1491]|uniref:primosomal protein N' family DNA-binding protein n=1 Tax=Georgenia sp. Z1491 TaxID=3416707 RepID=UPI003CF1E130